MTSVLPLTITTFCIAGEGLTRSVVVAVVAEVIGVVLIIIMVRLPGRLPSLQESCHRCRAGFSAICAGFCARPPGVSPTDTGRYHSGPAAQLVVAERCSPVAAVLHSTALSRYAPSEHKVFPRDDLSQPYRRDVAAVRVRAVVRKPKSCTK